MGEYIVRRLLFTLFLLVAIGTIVFFMTHLLPGDPAMAILGGPDAAPDPQSIERVRADLGLDLPLHIQYANWGKRMVRFDFGTSYITNQSIADDIRVRLMRSLLIIIPASILAVIIGVIVGIMAASLQRSFLDPLISALMLIGFSVPPFITGTLMVLLFAVSLGWLPSGGFMSPLDDFGGYLSRAIMPIISLAIPFAAIVMRMTRSSILENLRMDYVRTAYSKGIEKRKVLFKHVLRNALIPVISICGLQFGRMIGGSLLVETIYNWPGFSAYLINALSMRDYPTVQSSMLVIAVFFLVINLISDLLYGIIDPRISYK